ncbi:MAG: tyrosine-type recombinase/integrase [Nostoc sp.]
MVSISAVLAGLPVPGKTTLWWADEILRTAVDIAGLCTKGISTHSTRRSFITNLANKGVNLATIKKITGHTDLKVLSRYIEVKTDSVRTSQS